MMLVKDPIEYENAYKRLNVWSIKDIQVFLKEILETPKNFWLLSKKLPHKTAKEMIFFFYSLKKLMNFKKYIRNNYFTYNPQNSFFKTLPITDSVEEIMKPIYKVAHDKKANKWINSHNNSHFPIDNLQYFHMEDLINIYTLHNEQRKKAKELTSLWGDNKINEEDHKESLNKPNKMKNGKKEEEKKDENK